MIMFTSTFLNFVVVVSRFFIYSFFLSQFCAIYKFCHFWYVMKWSEDFKDELICIKGIKFLISKSNYRKNSHVLRPSLQEGIVIFTVEDIDGSFPLCVKGIMLLKQEKFWYFINIYKLIRNNLWEMRSFTALEMDT